MAGFVKGAGQNEREYVVADISQRNIYSRDLIDGNLWITFTRLYRSTVIAYDRLEGLTSRSAFVSEHNAQDCLKDQSDRYWNDKQREQEAEVEPLIEESIESVANVAPNVIVTGD